MLYETLYLTQDNLLMSPHIDQQEGRLEIRVLQLPFLMAISINNISTFKILTQLLRSNILFLSRLATKKYLYRY